MVKLKAGDQIIDFMVDTGAKMSVVTESVAPLSIKATANEELVIEFLYWMPLFSYEFRWCVEDTKSNKVRFLWLVSKLSSWREKTEHPHNKVYGT